MPTETPPTSVVTDRTISVTPAQASRLDAAAHAGVSRAEQLMAQNKAAPIAPTAEDKANFDQGLAAAQAKDRGAAGFNGTKPDEHISTKVDPEDDPHFKKEGAAPAGEKKVTVPGLPEWKPKTQEASKHWEEMKAKHAADIAQAKADVEAAKAELARAKADKSPEVEKLQTELNQYREILRDVAIERDPEFKQRFGTRQEAAINAAKLAAGEAAGKLEALLKAPSSPWRDEQINALMEDLPASSQRRVNAALAVLEQIDVERESEIASRRTTFDQKQSALMTQQQRQHEERVKQLTGAFDATLKEWSDPKSGNPFFVEKEGDDEHNAGVKEGIELSKAIFNGQMEPQDLARAALWAAMGPRALDVATKAIARAEKAERMIAKLQGVQPGAGRGGSVSETPAGGEIPKAGTPQYDEYMRRGLQQAQMADRQRGG